MRKIIFGSAVSADGFIEGPNGDLDWLVCEEENFDACAFVSQFDTAFFGRKACERFTVVSAGGSYSTDARWQFQLTINHMRKYVFSRTEKHVPGNGMVMSGNIEAEVNRIRQEKGKNIWFGGGADILKTFAGLDLVDEYVLTVHPVVLKGGKPLFDGIRRSWNLRLVDKRNQPSGVMTLQYQPESRAVK